MQRRLIALWAEDMALTQVSLRPVFSALPSLRLGQHIVDSAAQLAQLLYLAACKVLEVFVKSQSQAEERGT